MAPHASPQSVAPDAAAVPVVAASSVPLMVRYRWWMVALAVGGLVIFSGCRQLDRLSGASGAPCASTADCADGLTCLTESEGFPGGYCSRTNCENTPCPGFFGNCIYLDRANNVTGCVETCGSTGECRAGEGYICADLDGDRGCLPEAQSTGAAGSIGASCARDTDCDGGLTCLTSFVFGYCTRACTSNADCGTDICSDVGGGTLRCTAACDNSNQCRFGYGCRDEGAGGTCLPDEGGTAVRNPNGAADGEPCTADIQCQGGTCLLGSDFPSGYCSTRDCDSVGCASENATCTATQTGAFCFENCATSTDCRDGYRCTSLETGGNVCYSLSPITAPDTTDGGPIALQCDAQTVSGNRRRITFDLDPSTIAFTVTPFSPDGDEVEPISMTLPDGTLFTFATQYEFQTINSLLLGTIVPMLFPGAPAFGNLIQSGTYEFVYETDDANSCYFVLEQPAEGTTLDVNFYFVGVPNVNAGNAESNASMTSLVSEFRAIYQNANINIGTIRYFDVTGPELDQYRIIRDFADIYRLLGTSEAPGTTRDDALSINVFLIQDFSIAEIPGLLGLSAGIPGVPGVHGNGGAGLVFTSIDLPNDPASLGQTLGHEVGHFLGLRHTSERDGSRDPLDDTPSCADPTRSFDCPDVNNLMFPFSVDGVTQRTVTADQRYVLRRNPLVK